MADVSRRGHLYIGGTERRFKFKFIIGRPAHRLRRTARTERQFNDDGDRGNKARKKTNNNNNNHQLFYFFSVWHVLAPLSFVLYKTVVGVTSQGRHLMDDDTFVSVSSSVGWVGGVRSVRRECDYLSIHSIGVTREGRRAFLLLLLPSRAVWLLQFVIDGVAGPLSSHAPHGTAGWS